MRLNFLLKVLSTLALTSQAIAQDYQPQLDLGRLAYPELSIQNLELKLNPQAAAQPDEIFRIMTPSRQGQIENIVHSLRSTPSIKIEVIDQAFINWGTGVATELRDPIIGASPHLKATPDGLLRRGIVEQYVNEDPAAAVSFYMNASKGGDAWGALFSGRALLQGYGTTQDFSEGLDFLSNAANSSLGEVQSLANLELAQYYAGDLGADAQLDLAEQFYIDAIAADVDSIPQYVDFMLEKRGLSIEDPTVQEQIAKLADVGNASALFVEYQDATFAERNEIIADLQDLEGPAADIFLGDVFLQESDFRSAFDAFNNSSNVNSYALAQTGVLALNNPDADLGLNETQALGAVREAAGLGEPLALLELAKRSDNVEDRYRLAQQAKENDPSGRYTSDILSIQGEVCAVNQEACPAVPIWYVTNREKLEDDRVSFANRLGGELSSGIARTVIRSTEEPNPESNNILEIIICAVFPSTCRDPRITIEVGVPDIAPIDLETDAFIAELKASANQAGKQQVVVYVHGFNNTFDVAAERLAKLTNRGRLDAVPLMFSWASGGEPLLYKNTEGKRRIAYTHDLRIAERSCDAFHSTLSSVIRHFGSENVHIIAHSMGSHVVEMIAFGCGHEQRALPEGSLKSVIFAAADVDRGNFELRYSEFRAMTEYFTLYVTTNDAALRLASDVVHRRARLGQGGPSRFLREGTTTIDSTPLERVAESGNKDHSHVFDVPEVRRDVAHVLKSRFEIGDPRCLTRTQEGGYYLSGNAC